MNRSGWAGLQYAAACLVIVAYAVLAHYCNSSPAQDVAAHDLGAALALAPPITLAVILAWRIHPTVALLLAAGVGAVLFALWPLLRQHFALLSLIEETSVYGLLSLTFGRTLLGNRLALCTALADRVHGPLSAAEVRYTRQVTAAWAIFFAAIATVSVLLYRFTPLRLWSGYINFCVVPLIGAMFVAESLVRRRALPPGRRAGLLATMRVYFAAPGS